MKLKDVLLCLGVYGVTMYVFLFFVVPGAKAGVDREFIGSKKCSICHKSLTQGEQYQKWQASKHAQAFEVLGTAQAKEAGAKLGVEDPQTSGKCLNCHSTAYWFSESKVSENILVEEGVSCESCHGPGKDYMKKSVMEDRNAAIAQGLIIPNEETCRRCHNEQSPTLRPFDYKERWEQIKHPFPKKDA